MFDFDIWPKPPDLEEPGLADAFDEFDKLGKVPPPPPSPRGFAGMLDGYEEEVVPGLGVSDEEVEVGPVTPNAELICEPGDRPVTGGGGIQIPGIGAISDDVPSIEEEDRRLKRELIVNPVTDWWTGMY